MKTRKKTQKQIDKWNAEFAKLGTAALLKLGAVPDPQKRRDLLIETKYGPLGVSFNPGFAACVFHDAEKHKPFKECNPHSGKWNHHFDVQSCDPATSAMDVEYRIKDILSCDRCGDNGSVPDGTEWLCLECKAAVDKEPKR